MTKLHLKRYDLEIEDEDGNNGRERERKRGRGGGQKGSDNVPNYNFQQAQLGDQRYNNILVHRNNGCTDGSTEDNY